MDSPNEKNPVEKKVPTSARPGTAPRRPSAGPRPSAGSRPSAGVRPSAGTRPSASSAPKSGASSATSASGTRTARKPTTVKSAGASEPQEVKERLDVAGEERKVDAKHKERVKEGKKPKVNKIDADDVDVVKSEAESEEDKKKKRKILLIILLIFLFTAAVGTAVYFIAKMQNIVVDFSVQIKTLEIQDGYVDEQGYPQKIKYVPGDDINLDLVISLKNNLRLEPVETEAVYVRVKIDLEANDTSYIYAFTPIFEDENLWIKGDDGYYYYTEKHIGGSDITDIKGLHFNIDNGNDLNGSSGTIMITVDIVEANYSAVQNYWIGRPDEWVKLI